MSTTWRWIFGIVFGLAILGLLGFGGSTRRAYREARQAARGDWHNVTWKWTRLVDNAKGTTTNVPNPAQYTILFKTDGTFEGQADCNKIAGSYSTDNGNFTIKVGPSTMAFCGEQSLDTTYLALLSNIVAGGPDGAGGFALETAGGAQRMEFQQ
jgi:heat shock protein HslJ